MPTDFDAIIIGGGPAGLAAATMLAEARKRVLVCDPKNGEGYTERFRTIAFPGFPEGVRGKDLVENFRQTCTKVGVQFKYNEMTNVNFSESPFLITSPEGQAMTTTSVIIATGASQRSGWIPGERELLGAGVFHHAADRWKVKEKEVAVIGKTLAACEEVLSIRAYASKVFFILPSSKLDAPEKIAHALESDGNISILHSASIKQINGTDRVTSVSVLAAGQEKEIPIDGVFLYTHDYHADHVWAKCGLECGEKNAILVDEEMMTSIKGIFACGDVMCGQPQLPAISYAQGLIAGMNTARYLTNALDFSEPR